MFAAVMMPSAVPMGPGSPDRLPSRSSMQMSSFASSPFRPSRPSPLSSSPIRASPSPPHTSSQMDTQSSPIHSSQQQPSIFNFSTDAFNSEHNSSSNNKLFRYASRPVKQVARGQQTRDAAQQTRRTLFLRNVRQRTDDRGWERRNFEQELQRMEHFSGEEEFRRAREAEAAELFAGHNLDEEIEDSLRWAQLSQPPNQTNYSNSQDSMVDSDEHIADLLAMEEEAELERLLALEQEREQAQQEAMLPQQPATQMQEHQLSRQPSSHSYSDDSEYDDIFAELASADEDMDMDL